MIATKSQRLKLLRVTREDIAKAIIDHQGQPVAVEWFLEDFPEGTKVEGSFYGPRSGDVLLCLSHLTFPMIREGQNVPVVTPKPRKFLAGASS